MVRLSPAQEKFLKKLQETKLAYDTAIADLEVEMRVRREAAKAILVPVVQEALDAAIPARQVAIKGLGYADVGSLKQYMIAPESIPVWEPAKVSEAAKPTRGEYEVQVRKDASDGALAYDYLVTDTFGEEFLLTGSGNGDAIEFAASDVDSHSDSAEIRAAVEAAVTVEWADY